jgi:hypothetical protein
MISDKEMESLATYANPKIKRVIIQMGMDKTATTSIQLFLSRNRAWLNENDLEYKTDWGADNHSVPLKSLLSDHPEKIYWHIVSGHKDQQVRAYNDKNLRALAEGIKACQQESYIFFGEGICGFKVKELRRLKQLIHTLMPVAKIELLYCVRSNTGYASSGYQQAVRMGQSYSRLKLIQVYSNIYFRRIIRAMFVFGKKNMQVYKFEDTKRHAFGPVGYFVEKIGACAEELAELEMPTANESLSYQATEIIEFVNHKLPLVIENKLNPKRQKSDMEAISRILGVKYRLSSNLISKINRFSLVDILWLKFTFHIRYPLSSQADRIAEIAYDESYYQHFIDAFVESNDEIQICLNDFIKIKSKTVSDKKQSEVLLKIQRFISDYKLEVVGR